MSVNLKGIAILNIQSADYHPFTNRIKNFTKKCIHIPADKKSEKLSADFE